MELQGQPLLLSGITLATANPHGHYAFSQERVLTVWTLRTGRFARVDRHLLSGLHATQLGVGILEDTDESGIRNFKKIDCSHETEEIATPDPLSGK